MKKRNWLYVVLILLCLGAFFGYWALDRISTDRQPPEITFSENLLAVSALDPSSALLQGVTATDDFDGDVTASLVVESVSLADSDGTVNVSYAAFDAAGNVAKAQRQARYMDYVSPRFTLSRPLAYAQNASINLFNIVTANDMVEGDITHRIRITSLGQEALSSVGTHDVELRVSNSLGETVELVVPVEVYPTGTYDASIELTDYLVYVPVGTEFSARKYLSSFVKGSERVSLTDGVPSAYSLYISGTVDTSTPGVYPIGYRITELVNDSSMGKPYVGYTKLIVVVEG